MEPSGAFAEYSSSLIALFFLSLSLCLSLSACLSHLFLFQYVVGTFGIMSLFYFSKEFHIFCVYRRLARSFLGVQDDAGKCEQVHAFMRCIDGSKSL